MSLIERRLTYNDALSSVLRSVRLDGSVQFCFLPTGDWFVDEPKTLGPHDETPGIVWFHIIVSGECWLEFKGRRSQVAAGDVIAFPHGSRHMLGGGDGGSRLHPLSDLPTSPWTQLPILAYGDGRPDVRIICGYMQCEALAFLPIRAAMPDLIHVHTADGSEAGWLGAAVGQIVSEIDHPSAGGRPLLERMTEMMFLELLRREVAAAETAAAGWLAGIADPAIGKCLSAIHGAPYKDWTIEDLADLASLSRTVLIERFRPLLGAAPIRYIRTWRLHLASQRMLNTLASIQVIANDAGYASEAAFNRAFKEAYGQPPVAWRAARL